MGKTLPETLVREMKQSNGLNGALLAFTARAHALFARLLAPQWCRFPHIHVVMARGTMRESHAVMHAACWFGQPFWRSQMIDHGEIERTDNDRVQEVVRPHKWGDGARFGQGVRLRVPIWQIGNLAVPLKTNLPISGTLSQQCDWPPQRRIWTYIALQFGTVQKRVQLLACGADKGQQGDGLARRITRARSRGGC